MNHGLIMRSNHLAGRHAWRGPIACAALLAATGSVAWGQTITVDTSDDTLDFGGLQTIADLPGPDGKVSLVEAGLASDNTPGIQTIAFNVPRNEWLYQWLFPGRVVLKPFLGFRIFQPAILDATTQTAFTGDTYADGGEVVIWQESYVNDTVGSIVRGFDHSNFHISGGSNNTIQGNTLGNIEIYGSSFNLIGGTGPGEGNAGGVIQIDRASNNTVVGNTASRVRVLGWFDGGQPAANNRIGGPTLQERNFITGMGTWNSEGFPGGFAMQIFDTSGTIVENNWIGTTPDGMQQGHLATTAGISFEGQNHGALIRNNRIAGILGHGIGPHYGGWLVGTAINVYGTGDGITIVGNAIGLNANNEPVLGSVTGITTTNYYLGPVQQVAIGGSAPGDGNEVAGHLLAGISVANTFSGVRISGNSIHGNGSVGIDLITDAFQYGVTLNDALDPDTGANGLQNYPVLTAATTSGSTTEVQGMLASLANQTFTLEFFASPGCDPSGYGEGELYLGAATVLTDGAGNAAFSVILSVGTPAGSVITSTAAQGSTGNTSEFSACIAVVAVANPLGDLNGDGQVDGADLGVLLGAWGTGNSAADLNGDGAVDGADLGTLLGAWSSAGE